MDTNTVLQTLGSAASAFGPWGQAIGMGLNVVGSLLPNKAEEERKKREAIQGREAAFAGGTGYTQDTKPPDPTEKILGTLGSTLNIGKDLITDLVTPLKK